MYGFSHLNVHEDWHMYRTISTHPTISTIFHDCHGTCLDIIYKVDILGMCTTPLALCNCGVLLVEFSPHVSKYELFIFKLGCANFPRLIMEI